MTHKQADRRERTLGVGSLILENRDIVTKGVRPPKAAAKLLAVLKRYSAKEDTD